MPSFLSNNIEINYEQFGEVDAPSGPIVLVHGFASNGRVNWVATGWVDILVKAGFAPVIMDNRGHGKSEKLYDSSQYPAREMAKDVAGLIMHLEIGAVPIMGYSMGARICAFVAMDYPQVVQSAIFGGLGINMVRGMSNSDEITAALLAPSMDQIKSKVGRSFRLFAERTKSDLRALAACMEASRDQISAENLSQIEIPVLVAVGSDDQVGGDPNELADILPRGEALIIPDTDHMRATGDKNFKRGVLEFLARLTS